MNDAKAYLIKHFVDTKSFIHDPVNKFRLSSGILSDFYVDCKTVVADPFALAKIGEYSFEKVKNLEFDCIGGLEIGAIAIAAIISHYGLRNAQNWPNFVVRKQVKGHGLGKKIEGIVKEGSRALIVDDVLTSGGSILQAVEAARQAGLIVNYALVIVDREEQGGKQNLAQEGVELISLLTIKDFQSIERLAPAFSM
ncbi:MAG: orotate phosphoribosyltransferase [Nitrospira sp.]|nr:orotate phosphoribosyltransferase [Nitrospira sp.]